MKHIKLYEEYINEFSLFKKITDEDVIKYMTSHRARKKMWDEVNKPGMEVQRQAMINFFKENPHYVKNDELPMNIHWDENDKKYVHKDETSVVSPY